MCKCKYMQQNFHSSTYVYIISFKLCHRHVFCYFFKITEEKDVKTEDSGKLQNGENTKEGTTAAPVVNVSEEKKKATKQRFMFNIADGGFTGADTHTHTVLFSSV